MSPTRVLAQIKLRETQRQRDRLHRQYDAIEARVAQAEGPLERLRALHQGLREVTFAQAPLHPDVRELDALYLADELGSAPPELVTDRTRFLERELAQGRMRAEFTFAFGRILSDWASSEAERDPHVSADDPLGVMWEEAPALDREWLGQRFAENEAVLAPIRARVEVFARKEALAPVRNEEVLAILDHLVHGPYHLPVLRRQAVALRNSETQVTELAGVATILLNSLDEWDLPTEVPLRAVWARTRHRPFLDDDLVTALFWQLIGLRWGAKVQSLLVWKELRQGKARFLREEPPTSLTAVIHEQRIQEQAQRFLPTVPADFPEAGYRARQRAGYGLESLRAMLQTVERDIRFARAAWPDRPLFVVQVDLRELYPSLSHDLLLEVMRQLGVPQRWLDVFARFLRPRVRYRDTVRPLARGLPLEHALGDLLAECVLWLLDLHVYRTTGTLPIRVVDDMWFLTDSHGKAQHVWREVQSFCQACGLAVNDAKSGSVAVGAPSASLEGLPAGRPRWGLLRLQADGTWEVDEPAFAQMEEVVRRELAVSPSVLALVARYNSYLHYALHQLALSVPLQGGHLRRMGERLNRMHEGLFGAGHGLIEEVSQRLKDSFADARLKEQGLPHALIYWPITAGGLALAHPLLRVASYVRGRMSWQEPTPEREVIAAYLWQQKGTTKQEGLSPADLERLGQFAAANPRSLGTTETLERYLRAHQRGTDRFLPTGEEIDTVMAEVWAGYRASIVRAIDPTSPPELPAMERLVKDFIERGSEVSGHTQSQLSAYWRWVVYAYGPSLLEALGTFRFLMTELVPLQLILENRGVAESVADEAPPAVAAEGDDMPF